MENECKGKRYPVGIQSFVEIREGGYVYVDKSALIHQLTKEWKYYFLSRPRRFGKSLLLSTIEAYYKGRRDLFKGLAFYSLAEDWEPHPILHLDLNVGAYTSHQGLLDALDYSMSNWENIYGLANSSLSPSLRFGDIISKLHEATGKKVVILIDEYDKPMLNAIDDEELADQFRSTLKAFYSNLKSMDQHIEFAMLTGVARFSKLSIFSDLNNLRDISFEPKYSAICGVSTDELFKYFSNGISCLSARYGNSAEEIAEKLKKRYDGYHFAKNLLDIYNPFSLVTVFASENIGNYWFSSGPPPHTWSSLSKIANGA
ncbi:MAG: AAA family ATPase [Lachnospiraceae bacterium]|nr:AAA family ATPase [Lachnospiraceae bacterium]